MTAFEVHPIGAVRAAGDEFRIEVEEAFRPALKGLEGFSHLQVLWWFHEFDSPQLREVLQSPRPYRLAPETLGIFATRSPVRPNPLALTVVEVLELDEEAGILRIAYTDANDGSPVLDLKPYTPSFDRVETARFPHWCRHWPQCVEDSGSFDWEGEFLF